MWGSPASSARRNSARAASRSRSRFTTSPRLTPPSLALNSASRSLPHLGFFPNAFANDGPVCGSPAASARRSSAHATSRSRFTTSARLSLPSMLLKSAIRVHPHLIPFPNFFASDSPVCGSPAFSARRSSAHTASKSTVRICFDVPVPGARRPDDLSDSASSSPESSTRLRLPPLPSTTDANPPTSRTADNPPESTANPSAPTTSPPTTGRYDARTSPVCPAGSSPVASPNGCQTAGGSTNHDPTSRTEDHPPESPANQSAPNTFPPSTGRCASHTSAVRSPESAPHPKPNVCPTLNGSNATKPPIESAAVCESVVSSQTFSAPAGESGPAPARTDSPVPCVPKVAAKSRENSKPSARPNSRTLAAT